MPAVVTYWSKEGADLGEELETLTAELSSLSGESLRSQGTIPL